MPPTPLRISTNDGRSPTSYLLQQRSEGRDDVWVDGPIVEANNRAAAVKAAIAQGLIAPDAGLVFRVVATGNYEDFELAPRQGVDLRAVGE